MNTVALAIPWLWLSPSDRSIRADAEQPQPSDDFMNDDMDSYLIAMDTSIAPGPSTSDLPAPPVAASRKLPAPNNRSRRHSEEEEEEEDGEEDLERPPDKKVQLQFP